MNEFARWQHHWQSSNVPWQHEGADRVLVERFPHLRATYQLGAGQAVLIPLCGNSPAVKFFHDQGFSVTALDFVAQPLDELRSTLFAGLEFERREEGERKEYRAKRMRLVQDDVFHWQEHEAYDLVYDRASLIAIPPPDHELYARIIDGTIRQGGIIVLVSLMFDQERMEGPPYSLTKREILQLFPNFTLKEHQETPAVQPPPPFIEAGITTVADQLSILKKLG